jgi:hypothetical protein
LLLIALSIVANHAWSGNGASHQHGAAATELDHPRLYLTSQELPRLRAQRNTGHHQRIWRNLQASADWCLQQPPRTEWIPTDPDDPQYENLYDRFYAAMHDLAIVETLAFASVLSDPSSDPYFDHAWGWLLAASKVSRNEAENSPDASKAYAVLRITKGLAVSYDLLFDRRMPPERDEVRAAIVGVMDAYYKFFQAPGTAGEGYNKHHGSVDAAPFGIAALALLREAPEAEDWLKLTVDKHVDYLLPEALTPSGTNDQSSSFWASTLLYRILFMDALQRVTGRDLLQEFARALPGRIALAAVAGRQPAELAANDAIALFFSARTTASSTIGRPCFYTLPARRSVRFISTWPCGTTLWAASNELASLPQNGTRNSSSAMARTRFCGTTSVCPQRSNKICRWRLNFPSPKSMKHTYGPHTRMGQSSWE